MKTLHGKSILVVDDETDLADMLCEELTDNGATCQMANSVRQALNILESGSIDLVISDIRMPNESGLVLLESLQNNQYHLPLIFMTGQSDVTREEAIERGARAVVSKPFDVDELVGLCSKMS
jgi:DNA-binding NtrC family response regulator